MCLAVPMKIKSIEGNTARVSTATLELDVCLDLVESVQVGDYVLVHAGYAIERLSPDDAEERLAIFARLGQP